MVSPARSRRVTRPRRSAWPALVVVALVLIPLLPTAASAAPTDAPTDVSVAGGDGEVTVAWDAVAGAAGYQVIHKAYVPTHRTEASGPPPPPIVGGSQVSIEQYPWQVAILRATEPDPYQAQFCGGALIHEQWVLTAAHCVVDGDDNTFDPTFIHAAVGETALSQIASTDRLPIARIIVHPDYTTTTFRNDLALLELVVPTKDGSPVKLAVANPAEGTRGVVSGWGTLAFDTNQFPNKLRAAEVFDLAGPTGTCGNYGTQYAATVMLCVGLDGGGKDSCQGDSGGPLVTEAGTQWVLSGIVSNGAGCAAEGWPGLYTRVPTFVPWLRAQVPDLTWQSRPAATTTARLTGLTNSTRYEIRVAAVDGRGRGPYSDRAIGRPYTRTTKVRRLQTITASGAVRLTWVEPLSCNGSRVRDYTIIYRESGGAWQVLDDGKSTDTRVGVRGLTDGVEYEFGVAARNAAGRSRYRTVAATPG